MNLFLGTQKNKYIRGKIGRLEHTPKYATKIKVNNMNIV